METKENPALVFDDLISDVVRLIFLKLDIRGQLSFTSVSKKYATLFNLILTSSETDNRYYQQNWFQHHALNGDFEETLFKLSPVIPFATNDSYMFSTYNLISKILLSTDPGPELLTLRLLLHDKNSRAAVISCLAPYLLSSNECLKFRDQLQKGMIIIVDRQEVDILGKIPGLYMYKPEQLLQTIALMPWLNSQVQNRITRATNFGLVSQLSLQNNFVIPSFLRSSAQECFDIFLKTLKDNAPKPALLIENIIQALNPLASSLTESQILAYKECLDEAIIAIDLYSKEIQQKKNNGESTPVNIYIKLLDSIPRTIEYLRVLLRFKFSRISSDQSSPIVPAIVERIMSAFPIHGIDKFSLTRVLLLKSALIALHNQDDAKPNSVFICCEYIATTTNLKTKFYSYLMSEWIFSDYKKETIKVILEKYPNPDLTYEYFLGLLKYKLVSLAKSDSALVIGKSYYYLKKLKLITGDNNTLRYLQLNDDQTLHLAHACLNISHEDAIARRCLIYFYHETDNPDYKKTILHNLWQNRDNFNDELKSSLMHILCTAKPEFIRYVIDNTEFDEFTNHMIKRFDELRELSIHCRPFGMTLFLMSALHDDDDERSNRRTKQALAHILKPYLNPLDITSIFTKINALYDSLNIRQTQPTGALSTSMTTFFNISDYKKDPRYKLRSAVIEELKTILTTLTDSHAQLELLERARQEPLLRDHFSGNIFHSVGRSGGQIAIDEMCDMVMATDKSSSL